jgi:hypothetical protein
MKMLAVLFFIFIVFSPGVTAEEAEEADILKLLDMLISNQWDGSFDSLNYKATDPAAVWVSGPHMVAWVDIVGYRNMSRINNTDYIFGGPVDCVIVESEVKDLLTWNDNVDWIKKEYSYNVSDGNITVTLDITMLWHHSTEITRPNGNRGVKKDYNYEYMTITDTETIPLEYNYTSANMPISILFYNNTFSPKTIINVPGKDGLFYIEYSYNNESIKQNLMNAEKEKNSKGIEFINFSDAKKWQDPTGNLSYLAGSCVIKGANFTIDDLNISLRTPYRSIDATNYNLTINNVTAGSCINLSIIPFMVVVGLLLSTLYIIIKKTWG